MDESRQVQVQRESSPWALGWTVFAAVLMIVGGGWWLLAGSIALINSDFYEEAAEYVLRLDVRTWGWVHLIVGASVLVSGFGILFGAGWARVVGVIVSAVAALAAFAWLPWYPVWAVILIVVSVAVIWALTVHGRDVVTD